MLKGKNAIITGARRGIGRATVEAFAENGANVWACARKEDAAFEADMAGLAEKYGVWIKPVYFEMTDAEQMKQAVRQLQKEKIPVDILVNNAGEAQYDGFAMMPEKNLRRMMECNYISPMLFTQLIVRVMSRVKKGSIVFLSSVAGLQGEIGGMAYGGSKAAVAHATSVLGRELAGLHIRVNAVAPGVVDTAMKEQADGEYWENLVQKVPLNRMAQPKEIANAIAFLASDLASYITGQVIRVDGGL